MKNNGKNEWPSVFTVKLISVMNDQLLQNYNFEDLIRGNNNIQKTVKKGQETTLDIIINPIDLVGSFTFYFSLATLNGARFGSTLCFTFHLKDNRNLLERMK